MIIMASKIEFLIKKPHATKMEFIIFPISNKECPIPLV